MGQWFSYCDNVFLINTLKTNKKHKNKPITEIISPIADIESEK